MIGMDFKLEHFTPKRVTDAADRASVKNLGHAAASVRKRELESILPGDGPSAPGTPPHTRARVIKSGKNKGKLRKGEIQRAIVFFVDKAKQEAVIGPRFSVVGTSASAHEFGGEYKGQTYPERPFAAPALAKTLDRFAAGMAASIGS